MIFSGNSSGHLIEIPNAYDLATYWRSYNPILTEDSQSHIVYNFQYLRHYSIHPFTVIPCFQIRLQGLILHPNGIMKQMKQQYFIQLYTPDYACSHVGLYSIFPWVIWKLIQLIYPSWETNGYIIYRAIVGINFFLIIQSSISKHVVKEPGVLRYIFNHLVELH